MKKEFFRLISTAVMALFFSVLAVAQDGAFSAYSPYSVYGIGDLYHTGSAFSRQMGGVGVALRNRRFINYTNPAAVTCRDTLSFMANFGAIQNNVVYRQDGADGVIKSANNQFNISDIVMSFPIWRSSAFMIGVNPFSNVGYDFSSIETDPEIIGYTNNITNDSFGKGGLFELFVGAGATFWKCLSVGAQFNYYFGNIDKTTNMIFTDASYRSMYGGYNLQLNGITGKFGLQYEQKLGGNVSMVLGATYRMKTGLRGTLKEYRYASLSNVTDTLVNNIDTLTRKSSALSLGDEIAVGVSIKGGERWMAEFDYVRSDWSKTGFDSKFGLNSIGSSGRFTGRVSQSFRAGFEFTPNRNDVRYYYKRIAYRAGLYYEQNYYQLAGHTVTSKGVTFGVTLPVLKHYNHNGLTLGMDIGQRGSRKNGMVSETYACFVVGIDIHDIWFQKIRYQ